MAALLRQIHIFSIIFNHAGKTGAFTRPPSFCISRLNGFPFENTLTDCLGLVYDKRRDAFALTRWDTDEIGTKPFGGVPDRYF